jgi:tetratricopeptide (TPR) repeat protein
MLRPTHAWRWSAVLAACAWLGWAGTLIVRRAGADMQARSSATPGELERACQADPGRASCWARLAEAREAMGEDASAVWQKALDADPRNASVLTQAALAADARDDLATAERLLQQAARYNQLWLARWTLANFYYRHQRPEFWPSIRTALERSHGDPTAIFRLCRDAGAGASKMLDEILPPAPALLNAYVRFLIREAALDELPLAAERSAQSDTLLAAADALVQAERVEPALVIWNQLATRRQIPYPAWSAASPLVNNAFKTPVSPPVFDWKTLSNEDFYAIFGALSGGVKISLTGRQPEDAEILVQQVALQPGRRYRLSCEYQTRGITADDSALYWSILTARSEALAGSAWTPVWVRFEIPDGTGPRLAKLALVAGRKHGRARMQGEVWIRNLKLEPD